MSPFIGKRYSLFYRNQNDGTGRVYALDAATGTILWKYATEDRVYSSPVVANGTVYVGSYYYGYLYAIQ